ncbi:MAG: sulfurtransferase TusA family protein [Acidimicrobiia bacterium]|jgi:tRNA 2-thiouridine synthesizing protein A
MADHTVDARGLQCPMPVIKLSQAIMAAQPGQTVELISTDRGSCSDVPSWAEDMGQTLKEQFEEDGEFHFILVKS